jgi:glycosyltransferase involved in cell wall biosynthesis
MLILMIAPNDPAGTAICHTNAINRYTQHRCRLITTEIRYNFYFPKDIHVPWLEEFDELEYLLKNADIYHFHMWADEDMQLGPFKPRDFIKGKRVFHYHHGEPPFISNPRKWAERELSLGRKAAVDMPHLLKMYPEATYIPFVVPSNDVDYLPCRRQKRPQKIIITHSPSKKVIKNTDDFIKVTDELKQKYPFLHPYVIENTLHKDCLKIKRHSHIFFDHMQGYFGMSSAEALSMGLPTIAGLDDYTIEKAKEKFGAPDVPWVIAKNPQQLKEKIEFLICDEDARGEIGRHSREWVEKYWTEGRVAEWLIEFYLS